jgi:hypothetical protein
MNILNRVNNLLNKQESVDKLILTDYILCKTFGWDYYTLMSQPMPFAFDMLKMIKYEAEMQEKAMKKSDSKMPTPVRK